MLLWPWERRGQDAPIPGGVLVLYWGKNTQCESALYALPAGKGGRRPAAPPSQPGLPLHSRVVMRALPLGPCPVLSDGPACPRSRPGPSGERTMECLGRREGGRQTPLLQTAELPLPPHAPGRRDQPGAGHELPAAPSLRSVTAGKTLIALGSSACQCHGQAAASPFDSLSLATSDSCPPHTTPSSLSQKGDTDALQPGLSHGEEIPLLARPQRPSCSGPWC